MVLEHVFLLQWLQPATVAGAVRSLWPSGCFLHPIAHVPGPVLAKLSPLWVMRSLYRGRYNSDLHDLHERYGEARKINFYDVPSVVTTKCSGPVVRIAPNELSFASLEAQNEIYTKQEEGGFSKNATFIDFLTGLLFADPTPTLLTVSDIDTHKKLRRAVEQAFTPSALSEHGRIQKSHIDKAIRRLEECANDEEVDLGAQLDTILWGILADVTFGEPLTMGKKSTWESLKKVGKALMPIIEFLLWSSTFPGVALILDIIFWVLPYQNTPFSKILSAGKFQECLERQNTSTRKTFMKAMMNTQKFGFSFGSDAMIFNVIVLLFTGYQSSSIAAVALFYNILRNPEIHNKVRNEVRESFQDESEISSERLVQLPLLNSCIREALRLLPPANGKTAQRTSPECIIAETYVPKGTIVSADVYSIHRSARYFREPDSFRPERWLPVGKRTLFEGDNRQAYRPFLIGSRACVGKNSALQSLRLIVAKLLWKLDFEMVNKDFVWERDAFSSLIYTDYPLVVRTKRAK
nr:putative cytochrome P450 monooxygenase [Fusarium oxysporum]